MENTAKEEKEYLIYKRTLNIFKMYMDEEEIELLKDEDNKESNVYKIEVMGNMEGMTYHRILFNEMKIREEVYQENKKREFEEIFYKWNGEVFEDIIIDGKMENINDIF